MNKILPNEIISKIYFYDDTYKIYFRKIVLHDLKYKIFNIQYYINSISKNILILYKKKIFIHCDNLENPNFVSTCIFNKTFPIFDNKNEIKNYPEFIFQKEPENKKKIIDFIENIYSTSFQPFAEFFF